VILYAAAVAAIFFGETATDRIPALEPDTIDQAHLARQAFLDFGRGRHPA